MILSMTGWASQEFVWKNFVFRIELKSLNHRFLDQKYRFPRDLSRELAFLENSFRAMLEKQVKRGSVEVLLDYQESKVSEESGQGVGQGAGSVIDHEAAKQAYLSLKKVADDLGLAGTLKMRDVLAFPNVLDRRVNTVVLFSQAEEQEVFLKTASQAFQEAVRHLLEMRALEGQKLQKALLVLLNQMSEKADVLKDRRTQIQLQAQQKIKRRMEQAIESFPAQIDQNEWAKKILEAKIAQEVSLLLERLDIEEELTRFQGHLHELVNLFEGRSLVAEKSSLGKKVDFLLQETNREVNTMSNKAQDLDLSQTVVELKLLIEQIREQSLNLE